PRPAPGVATGRELLGGRRATRTRQAARRTPGGRRAAVYLPVAPGLGQGGASLHRGRAEREGVAACGGGPGGAAPRWPVERPRLGRGRNQRGDGGVDGDALGEGQAHASRRAGVDLLGSLARRVGTGRAGRGTASRLGGVVALAAAGQESARADHGGAVAESAWVGGGGGAAAFGAG